MEGYTHAKPVLDALDLHLIAIGLMYCPRAALATVAEAQGKPVREVIDRLESLDHRIAALRADL